MNDLAGLNEGARTFAGQVLARHPEWGAYLRPYRPAHRDDQTAPGSLWLEFPGGGLTVLVQDTEALLARGRREQLFVWQPAERGPATAEVVGAVEAALAQAAAAGEEPAAV